MARIQKTDDLGDAFVIVHVITLSRDDAALTRFLRESLSNQESQDLMCLSNFHLMRHFLAIQEFLPAEQAGEGCCIWCGQDAQKNRAHIISQKLAGNSTLAPVLKQYVCANCNTACGKIEDWILHNTPLGWIRHFLYPSANRNSQSPRTPAYFYALNFTEWIIYTINPAKRQRVIPTQLILNSEDILRLFTELSPENQPSVTKLIFETLKKGDVIKDVKPNLPENFCPRVLLDGHKLVLISKSEDDVLRFNNAVDKHAKEPKSAERLQLMSSGEERQHFRWSKENWVKFCAKVSYETLGLFAGRDKCLNPSFYRIREYVLSGPTKKSREVVFGEHGPLGDGDVPHPVCVDLSVGQNSPQEFPAMLSHAAPGMHSIVIYEMEGWICSSISFAGFPPSLLILGGPNEHLEDIYQLTYDDMESQFHFARLAFDPSKPIIPMIVNGDIYSTLSKTYRLHTI